MRSIGNRPAETHDGEGRGEEGRHARRAQSNSRAPVGGLLGGRHRRRRLPRPRALPLPQRSTVRDQDVYINAGPERAFRAPGHPQGAWALEITMDALAAKLGIDPVELRLKNIPSQPGTRAASRYTTTGLRAVPHRRARRRSAGPRRARRRPPPAAGVVARRGRRRPACGVAGNGGPPATVIVQAVQRRQRAPQHGRQRHRPRHEDVGRAMIVAEELDVPVERISIEHADTATTQFATPSGGSKTVPTEAPAIRAAALEVKRQLLQLAAGRPEGAGRRPRVRRRRGVRRPSTPRRRSPSRAVPAVRPPRPARRRRLPRAEPAGQLP